jgi:pyruvate dehydrogenase E1 component alpha subunit
MTNLITLASTILNREERILFKAACCRVFEEKVAECLRNKLIKIPTYLSVGQEFIAATISDYIFKPAIFAQHRAHSTYLCFGGDIESLIDELLGKETGCAKGMGGSASIHSPDINMFGHSGLMGDQVPLAVGHCLGTKNITITFMGDASCEEDYVLGAMGYAAHKKLPILFVIEDNNLSILTEKKVRRDWDIASVGRSFGLNAYEVSDLPAVLGETMEKIKLPGLINVLTTRMLWHAGFGNDGPQVDRLQIQLTGREFIMEDARESIIPIWDKQLQK